MNTIASFTVDHDRLRPGMYISRIDGDAVTYDVRMKTPNGGDYLGNGELHTLEHLMAVYARNSAWAENVLYVGPMGCRTGFYLLLRNNVSFADAIRLVRECFEYIAGFDGVIPGSRRQECGNYLEHDLPAARRTAADMAGILEHWTPDDLRYR